jgi:hypothetical protein
MMTTIKMAYLSEIVLPFNILGPYTDDVLSVLLIEGNSKAHA